MRPLDRVEKLALLVCCMVAIESVLVVAAGGCASDTFEPGPDASGIVAPPDLDRPDCDDDPCVDVALERFFCLRTRIDACGSCETFYCPGVAVSVCQRPCVPPEP